MKTFIYFLLIVLGLLFAPWLLIIWALVLLARWLAHGPRAAR